MDPDITTEQAEAQAREAVQQGYRHFTSPRWSPWTAAMSKAKPRPLASPVIYKSMIKSLLVVPTEVLPCGDMAAGLGVRPGLRFDRPTPAETAAAQ